MFDKVVKRSNGYKHENMKSFEVREGDCDQIILELLMKYTLLLVY